MVCSVTDDVSKAKWVHVKGNICEYKIDKFESLSDDSKYSSYDAVIIIGKDYKKLGE